MYTIEWYVRHYFEQAKRDGQDRYFLNFEQASNLLELQIALSGIFEIEDRLIKWTLIKEGEQLVFEDKGDAIGVDWVSGT